MQGVIIYTLHPGSCILHLLMATYPINSCAAGGRPCPRLEGASGRDRVRDHAGHRAADPNALAAAGVQKVPEAEALPARAGLLSGSDESCSAVRY